MSVRIFVAGDLHIPSRAAMIHPKFKEILQKETWDYIVLTGDLTIPEVLDRYILHVKDPKHLIVCRGNMDQILLPDKPVFKIKGVKLGAFHGTGIYPRGDVTQLKQVADEMDVDILFTGHSHLILLYIDEEHIILNPGTSSGASGGSSWTVDTGIMVLSIDTERKITIETYQLVKKGRINHTKKAIVLEKKK